MRNNADAGDRIGGLPQRQAGSYFYLLGLLLALMVIDYLSGMAASRVEALEHPNDKTYGWSSRKGAIRDCQKVAYLFVIAVAMVIDYVIIQTSKLCWEHRCLIRCCHYW